MSIADGHKVFGEMDRLAAEVAESLKASSCLSLPIGRYYAGWAAVTEEPAPDDLPRGRDGLRLPSAAWPAASTASAARTRRRC